MRLHRFFMQQDIRETGGLIVSNADLVHQLRRVFRFTSGDSVILFDGSGFDYISQIISFGKEDVTFLIQEKKENKFVPKTEIYLFASLIKNSNYEWVLEKCTELGVSHFVPIISERSEKKNLNYERAKKIIIEATEQSGRGTLPQLHDLIELKDVFQMSGVSPVAFDVSGVRLGQDNFKIQMSNIKENKIGILIGPEGGWSEKELQFFREKNIPIYSLGTQTLRAETASIAISALLLL